MEKTNLISVEPIYKMIRKESLEEMDIYSKFLNWLSGEFDLYLQEDNQGLKVYVPNGWFSVKKNLNLKNEICFEIMAVNKSKVKCEILFHQVTEILDHIKKRTLDL